MSPARRFIADPGGRATAGLVLLAAGFLAWQAAGWGGPDIRPLVSDLAFVPVSITAALLALRASRHEALDPRTRRAWRIVGASFALYWLGDVLWTLEESLGRPAFPSPADAFYLAFYPTLLWGVLAFPAGPRSSADRLKLWLDTATVVVGAFMLLWFFSLGPTARQAGASALNAAVSLAYPIGDLVLVAAIARILLGRPPAGTGHALGILAAGLALFVVADVGYAALALREAYSGGDWPDALWMVGQVAMAVAAHHQHRHATRVGDPTRERLRRVRPLSPLPYAVVLAAFGLLAVVGWEEAAYPLGGLLLGALVVVGLVILRQIASIRENLRLLGELHHLATVDSLTGLLARRHFFELAEREVALARRSRRPLAAMMMDVDRFKAINDAVGHAAGDAILAAVGARVRSALREGDLVGRYGGDELVVLMPETGLEEALAVADRLHAAVESAPVETERGPMAVSLSIGVAAAEGAVDLDELLARADHALYEAKQAGRRTTRHAALPAGA
jgi:diguanylate cyclase (GGDEF)-like protein